ncbi:tyrosine-type recombinase/integrase [Wansuia hejianensis]|uniref:Tyrosine-type recombinase/integrase n=1 Tax=Wansuia hejianensis TaxID=2763667 RepID=A0A7G9GHF9_9FIRM|nr:tyrosine-type recombinase/integrase [Wansuia hejianensis]QNM10241.1 tyrosine-type recombinase/integrase [Wansuia hejianensis]RHV84220.1 integrase [Lachnospiraceae bacterium OF09-33XD]
MEKLIEEILEAMQDNLSQEQLQRLENVLIIKTHGLVLQKERTDLIVSERRWEKALRLYLASKRLENCSEGTIENYDRCVRMLMQTIGKRLPEITTNDLRYYLAMYQERRRISLSYLETLRHYISSFFSWLSDEGYISGNPARRLKRVKVPRRIKRPYSAEEREHLRCIAQTERDLALMEVLYSTAGRIGEVLALNRSDVDFIGREVIVYGKKSKKERVVCLTEEAAYHLRKYLEKRVDENQALFVSLKAPHERLTSKAVQAMLRKLGQAAGIHAHPHKFRRTLLTDASARGMSLQELQAYAGHAKPETTMIYVTVRAAEVKASFRRLVD